MKVHRLKAYGLLTLVSLLWSGTYVFVKIADQEFDPLTVMAGRAISSALFVFIVVLLMKKPLRAAWQVKTQVVLLFSSILIAAMWVTLSQSEMTLSASMTSFLMTSLVVFSWLISMLFNHERGFKWAHLLGIVIAALGTLVILGPENILHATANLWASLLYMFGLFLFAIAMALNKKYCCHIDPFVSTCFNLFYIAIILSVLSIVLQQPWQQHYSVKAISAVLAVGIVSTGIGYVIFFWLAKHVGQVFAAMNSYLVPIFTFAVGCIFLAESIALSQIIGLLITFAGMYLIES